MDTQVYFCIEGLHHLIISHTPILPVQLLIREVAAVPGQPDRKLCFLLLYHFAPPPISGISSSHGPWTLDPQHWSPSISFISRTFPHFEDIFSLQELHFHLSETNSPFRELSIRAPPFFSRF